VKSHSPQGGAGKKRGAKIRADEQEPDMRPTVAGERANDCEAHIHIKLTGGKPDGCASKAVELTSGDLRHVTKS
jgi:hypothetical protein